MPDLRVGTADITKAYLGDTELQKVYLGDVELYSSAPPQTTILVQFDALSDFTAAFTGELTDATALAWNFLSSGSTNTTNTGPGTNNTLPYVYTESSGITSPGIAVNRSRANFASVPTGTARMLRLRLCLQGATFTNAVRGLEVQHRATTSDTWATVTIPGYAYSDTRTTGDTFQDVTDTTRTVVADGGWVDYTISIPDTVLLMRIRQQIATTDFHQDIGFREFEWTYTAP